MENKQSRCLCGGMEYVVLACSGACDLGRVTDVVARKLNDTGVRKMNCLALIGAGIEKSIGDFKRKNILMLDGCSIECGKHMLDKAGITNFMYLRVTDLGFKIGQTSVTEEVIKLVYNKSEIMF